MKITIFGATGGIGRHLVDQALATGHDVTAVVRDPSKLAGTRDRVRVVIADLANPDPAALASAVAGADAVLSGLGPRSLADAGITSRGTRPITEAMREQGVRRIVVVSAAPVSTVPSPGRPHPPKHDPGDGFVMRHLVMPPLKAIMRKHYTDLALMEDDLRASGLEWTVVRPPRLTNKPMTGVYRTAYGQNVRRGIIIPRADVAHGMLRALDQPETIKQAIGIAT